MVGLGTTLSRRRLLRQAGGALAAPALAPWLTKGARAASEPPVLRLAVQFGIVYLPLLVIRQQRLIEAAATRAGLPEPRLEWLQFSSGAVMNDAVISGGLDFGAAGVPPILTAWDRTRKTLGIKAVAPLASVPSLLLTNRASINTLRDFGENDRIALPAAKVSFQAIALQMAAEQQFGEGQFGRLDRLTVTLGHPDAMAALIGGKAGITAHFANPPFQEQELGQSGIHTVLSSYDVMGGPHSSSLLYATSRFRDANPHWVRVVISALEAANQFIAADPRAAAELYIKGEKSNLSTDFVEALLRDPQNRYTTEPQAIMAFARFQRHTGQIAALPDDWRSVFFPELTNSAGS